MSTLTHEDPRLTAFALGELPADDYAVVAAAIARDPQLRVEVEQIRALSSDLTLELAVEVTSAPTLNPPQRAEIRRASKPRHSSQWRTAIGWGVFTTVAAAAIACVILPSIGVVREMGPSRLDLQPVKMATATPPPGNAPDDILSPTIEAPPEISADEALVILAKPTETDQAHAAQPNLPSALPPLEERTVAQSETGSTGTFLASGSGDRKALLHGREEAVADSSASASDSQPSFTNPAAGGGPVGTYGRISPIPESDRIHRPSPPTTGGFRLAPPMPTTGLPAVTPGGETYNQREDHGFRSVRAEPLSTFGLDVDTASYGNVRRMIESGRLPPRDAVRVEELVNYFPYTVPAPQNGEAFGVMVEVAPCPWQPAHQLARIAVRGKDLAAAARPALNLVFLVDVSGSMKPDNRLPLIKTGLSLLTTSLRELDHIAIITYANSAGVALPRTSGTDQRTILKAVDALTADGGTNGGSGIQLAYQAAREGFVHGGVNRVILCTDGDFNVGVTDRGELVRMVQERSQQGIFLTVLGVGQDNLKDATMELLADKANGHYHYLDTIAEARKVLVEQAGGTLVTIAKDVKAQVEFNPARIAAWRQLGYEKRALAAKDFNDDRKDAGEIGAGHLVTMLYELVPAAVSATGEGLRYQVEPPPASAVIPGHADELMTVKVRYKAPDSDTSQLVQGIVTEAQVLRTPSDAQTFAAAVAAFALRLRGADAMSLDWIAIRRLANGVRGRDEQGYRREFVSLIERVAAMDGEALPRE